MVTVSRTLLACLCLALLPASTARSSGTLGFCETVASGRDVYRARHGVTSWRKLPEGSRHLMVGGCSEINADPMRMMALMRNVKGMTGWVKFLETAELVEQSAEDQRVIYYDLDIPVIKDREVLYKETLGCSDQAVWVTLTSVEHPKKPTNDDLERALIHNSSYRVERVADGKVYVVVEVHGDPGRGVPAWLANLATRRWPEKTIQALQKLASMEPESADLSALTHACEAQDQ